MLALGLLSIAAFEECHGVTGSGGGVDHGCVEVTTEDGTKYKCAGPGGPGGPTTLHQSHDGQFEISWDGSGDFWGSVHIVGYAVGSTIPFGFEYFDTDFLQTTGVEFCNGDNNVKWSYFSNASDPSGLPLNPPFTISGEGQFDMNPLHCLLGEAAFQYEDFRWQNASPPVNDELHAWDCDNPRPTQFYDACSFGLPSY